MILLALTCIGMAGACVLGAGGNREQAGAGRDPLPLSVAAPVGALPEPDRYLPVIGGRIQFRFIANRRDDAEEHFATGFQIRRTRLNIRGDLPLEFSYAAELDLNRAGGAAQVLNAFFEGPLGEGLRFRAGQFVIPLMRERSTHDTMQLGMERSVLNDVFDPGFTQGVVVMGEWDAVRSFITFSDGMQARATDFDSSREADWAVTGRAEWRFGGNWQRFRDFTSWPGDPLAALIGAGIHTQSGGSTFGSADRDQLQYTVDAAFEGGGWNTFGALVGRRTRTGTDSVRDFGALVQGGAFIAEQTEVFARCDVLIPDGDQAASGTFTTLTIGANHYLLPRSHAAKVTGEVMVFLNRQSESSALVSANTGQGLLASGDRGQFVVRAQLQLVF